jgi:hypothetical protein
VAPARREVEHVARLEQPLVGRFEARQHLQRHVVAQARPRRSPDPPAPSPRELEQEHVVGIDVRADAAAVARERDHHVVEARVGNEAEAPKQPMRGGVVQVDALHQHAPTRRRQSRQGAPRQRPRPQRPALAVARDEARFDIVARRKGEQPPAVEAGQRIEERVAHEQGLLLPVTTHERRRGQPAEQRGRPFDVHRGHCAMIVRCRSAPLASSR